MAAVTAGAAWARGEMPPWMQEPPGFDEAAAADVVDSNPVMAAAMDLGLPAWITPEAAAVWVALDERFGSVAAAQAESTVLPPPLVDDVRMERFGARGAADQEAGQPAPPAPEHRDDDLIRHRRRTILNEALSPDPAAVGWHAA